MPGTTTGDFKFPVPAYGDSADGPKGFGDLGNAVDALLSKRFKASPEITSDATGAHLTGTRNGTFSTTGAVIIESGGLNIRGGTLQIGGDTTPSSEISQTNSSAGFRYVRYLRSPDDNYPLIIETLRSGVLSHQLYVTRDGTMYLRTDDTIRYVPFATWTWRTSLSYYVSYNATVALGFPAGRFTVEPVASVTSYHGSFYGYGYQAASTTGITVGAHAYDPSGYTTTVNLHVHVVQGTGGSALGRETSRATDTMPEDSMVTHATCHTVDCENVDIPIRHVVPDDGSCAYECGACGEPVTDVVED